MAKAKITPRKRILRTSIDFRTFEGKDRQYLIVKGRRRGADFFEAFAAVELKEAARRY
jgi:hypothetical protein